LLEGSFIEFCVQNPFLFFFLQLLILGNWICNSFK